jgi:chaperonin GroES
VTILNPLNLATRITLTKDVTEASNLCSRFSTADLDSIGLAVWQGYDRDRRSREVWEQRMSAGMDLAMQVSKAKNFPWPGCSNVIFPLVTIAALQFSARSYENIVQGTDVVRYRITNADPLTRERADRISKHMSWQVLEEDISWEEQHDRLLINLGIVGTNFIKTYNSARLGHNVSELILARDFVIDYWAKSVEEAPRKTHVVPFFRNEIYERVKRGVFRDVLVEDWYQTIPVVEQHNPDHDARAGLNPPTPPDEDTPFRCLEQHRLLDLDQDGYFEPYIVTIEEKSKKVLRIVARWEREEDIERTAADEIINIRATEYFTKYSFIPATDGGIYDIGFGVLLGPLNESVNTGINQMLDAGTMANSNGGFLGRGAKIRGGNYTFAPWEWVRVDSTGDDLRKSLVQLPTRDPSAVMFNLLSLLIDYTDRVAGTVDQAVGKNPGQNTPAETSRNSLEQGMRVYASIFKRVWRSLKEEFKKLHALNARYLPAEFHFGEKDNMVRQEDYRTNPDQVVPVADPNVTSQQLRIVQAQAIRQAAAEMPGYDRPLVEKKYLRALQTEGIDEIYPGVDKVPPLPNPKAQLEEMKLQAKKMDIEFKKQELIATLQSQREKTQAEITKLRAETVKILKDAQGVDAEIRLKAFDIVVRSLEAHNQMLTQNIQTLSAAQGDGDGDKGSSKGGMGDVGKPAGDSGSAGASAPVANGANGAMGGGAV